ncbi:cutinase [Dietzia sp. UCD-THP]|uniref:cutinase family protein n=1 Tax=Dietzia sp. UCD-THP TaxID=1292020 RepID=UPI0003808065|nr:cutinase family protein [Dietzia sp. UCD-THP]EYT62194.1 cutinase [Dietzia sp. UCD-THP]
MARGSRRGGGRRLGCSLGALVLVVLLVLGIGWWLGDRGLPTGPEGPLPGPAEPELTQPADCPDVQMIAVPGTWESSPTDDPYAPSFLPNALLRTITDPLSEQYPTERLEVFTVPYVAQFRNPQRPDEITYDQSRAEGTDRARAELVATHDRCPYTSYILLGFSQGAVIAGDLTSEIGTGNGPVPADLVRGSVLIADGRRLPGEGQSPGLSPGTGQGMEISLQPVTGFTQLIAGATMTGPRPGGFGELADRTAQICDSRDLICNAPLNVVDGAARFQEFVANNAIHAMYATNPDVVMGTTVPEWTIGHVRELVDSAPEIAHD